MRKASNVLRFPAILALLQPSPEVSFLSSFLLLPLLLYFYFNILLKICDLFDNLLVLNKGQVGYFGPYKQAVLCMLIKYLITNIIFLQSIINIYINNSLTLLIKILIDLVFVATPFKAILSFFVCKTPLYNRGKKTNLFLQRR